MVAPKTSLLTMPLRQGPKFRPLPSARRKVPLETIEDIKAWFASVPGKTYANEVTVTPSGAWPNIFQAPPQPLIEVIRVTLPRPAPVCVVIHPWLNNNARFRFALRMYAEMSTVFPALWNIWGRCFVEFGVGAARNWTYTDLAPGALQIPNAQWLTVTAWTHSQSVRLAATAQVGHNFGPCDATWTALVAAAGVGGFPMPPPHYAREVTGYFNGAGQLAASGALELADSALNTYQYFHIPSGVVPNGQAIPYAPVKVPLAGGVSYVIPRITNAGGGLLTLSAAAVCQIRI